MKAPNETEGVLINLPLEAEELNLVGLEASLAQLVEQRFRKA